VKNTTHVSIDLNTVTEVIDGETWFVTKIRSEQLGPISATHARTTTLSIALALDKMSRYVKQWALSESVVVPYNTDGKPRNCA
jgi:hypothetical protein